MIDKIKKNSLTWINMVDPNEDELQELKNEYKFHDLDLEDCRSKVQRPKFEEYKNYNFLVLQFPVMQVHGYRLSIEETDIFWGNDFIITLHSKKLSMLDEIFNNLKNNNKKIKKFFSRSPGYLLYKILTQMVISIFPLMNQISREIDYLDTNYDKIKASKIIERISALRRNIIFLQTSLKPQRAVFNRLENQAPNNIKQELDIYWGDIGDYLGKLIDMSEDYQELIEGLYSTIDTLLTFKMNNIMKTLTLFSVVMMPLTFITGFYGMNIRLPLQHFIPDTLITAGIITGIMILVTIIMLIYFKINKF